MRDARLPRKEDVFVVAILTKIKKGLKRFNNLCRISFYEDPDPGSRNVHTDPDADPRGNRIQK